MSNERRIIAVRLDEHALDVLFRDGASVRVIDGMPKDAHLLGVFADFARRCFVAHFEHPSFPVYIEGAAVPEQRIGFDLLEHPMADTWDMIPLRIGMDYGAYVDMRRWICERAAEIEGRPYP